MVIKEYRRHLSPTKKTSLPNCSFGSKGDARGLHHFSENEGAACILGVLSVGLDELFCQGLVPHWCSRNTCCGMKPGLCGQHISIAVVASSSIPT
jgi:hypothetical protein